MNWIKIVDKIGSMLAWPFSVITEIIAERQLVERRVYAISTFTKLSIDQVKKFAKNSIITLEDIQLYTSCYGKLPDYETEKNIYQYGFSRWRRRHEKGLM